MYDNENLVTLGSSAVTTTGRNAVISHLFYTRGMEATLQKLNNDFVNLNNQIANCENYIKNHPVKANQRSRKDYGKKPSKKDCSRKSFFDWWTKTIGWLLFLFGFWTLPILVIIISWLISWRIVGPSIFYLNR